MKKNIIIGALLLILGFVIGILCRPHRIERVVDIQRDTTILIDTHIIEKPVLVEKHIKDSFLVAVHDTTRIHDTLYLALPNETKVYWGDEYYAEVSGYNASLDYLELFTKTKVIRESVTKRNALSIGIETSYMNVLSTPIYLEYERMLHKNLGFYVQVAYDLPTKKYGAGIGLKGQIEW